MRDEDTIREIERHTGNLPPKQRIVFVLRDLQDLGVQEVSEITGINTGAVRTNLFLARRKIREGLEKMDKGGETIPALKGGVR